MKNVSSLLKVVKEYTQLKSCEPHGLHYDSCVDSKESASEENKAGEINQPSETTIF